MGQVVDAGMAKFKETISQDQAEQELQRILESHLIDKPRFMRGNFCLRVLGCPISDRGEFIVIEDQDGDDAMLQWKAYEFERRALKERHEDWLEFDDPDGD